MAQSQCQLDIDNLFLVVRNVRVRGGQRLEDPQGLSVHGDNIGHRTFSLTQLFRLGLVGLPEPQLVLGVPGRAGGPRLADLAQPFDGGACLVKFATPPIRVAKVKEAAQADPDIR